jgi:hypothetical protein
MFKNMKIKRTGALILLAAEGTDEWFAINYC